MDPLSITASIIAILQLTTKLITYLNDAKQTTSEQKKVAIEACNLYSLLAALRFRLDEAQTDDAWFDQVKRLGVRDGPLDQFKDVLEEILGHTAVMGKRERLTMTLTWRWSKIEVDRALQRMERLKTLVNLALTTDAFRLAQAIESEVSGLVNQTAALQVGVDELRTNADRDLQDKISRWLQIPDPSSNYQAALSKRHPQTGSWLLRSIQLQNWKSSVSSLLWLHGKAGCGKTILSATALEHVLNDISCNTGGAAAYFYFDFNNAAKQQTNQALRSLLFQFALKFRQCFDALKQSYQLHNQGQTQPSDDTIYSLLMTALAVPKQKYVIMDALDECTDRSAILAVICDLSTSSQHQVHILVTSRRECDIEEELVNVADQVVNIESNVVDSDISDYVHDRLSTDTKLKKWPMPVRDEIMNELTTKANGMFRWVFCQLESLRTCVKLSTLRKILNTLPKSLDETYARIIRNIESEGHLSDAVTMLQWLCFANRPLQLCEVVEILAIQQGEDGGFDPDERLPDPVDVTVLCSSLISCHRVRSKNDEEGSDEGEVMMCSGQDPLPITDERYRQIEVRLAHFSVKEYLLSDRSLIREELATQNCHEAIAEGCLKYLIYMGKKRGHKKLYPLAPYASCAWWQHVQHISVASSAILMNLSKQLFSSRSNMYAWVSNSDSYGFVDCSGGMQSKRKLAPFLYYACLIDMAPIVDHLLRQGADPNTYSSDSLMSLGTALYAACYRGGHESVQLLLRRGVDLNLKTGEVASPLTIAALQGHLNIVRLLLDNGMDANSWDGYSWIHSTALGAASETNNIKLAQLLLDRGANIDKTFGKWGSALSAAGANGHIQMVKLLLNNGADINYESGYDSLTPLKVVSKEGHLELVQLLLDGGAKVNIDGERYPTALQIAAQHGDARIVRLLVERGADVNSKNGFHDTALMKATESGHVEVVQLLLRNGAVVDAQNGEDGKNATALIQASYQGFTEITKLLLDSGANVHAQGGEYGTALQAASSQGRKEIVQLLLGSGADVNFLAGTRGSALYLASEATRTNKECFTVVEMLLEKGADTNAEGRGLYVTALQAALAVDAGRPCDLPTIRALVGAGADVNSRAGLCNATALTTAAESGNLEAVKLLLNAGAEVNPPAGLDCPTALVEASGGGYKEIVRLLLDRNANIDAPARRWFGELETSLKAASCGGHKEVVQLLLDRGAYLDTEEWCYIESRAEVVQLLLERGANVNARKGETPLRVATRAGCLEVAKVLVEKGADLNFREGEFNHNALQAASRHCNEGLVQLLLEHGADIHESGGKGRYGGTALHIASAIGHKSTVQFLLDNGAVIDCQEGDENKTALQLALENDWEEVALLLLDRGADFNIRGEVGHLTAVQCASSHGREQLLKVLLDRGAGANARRSDDDLTPLQLATKSDHSWNEPRDEIVRILIDNGADINVQGGEEKHTPLQTALASDAKEIVRILIKNGADTNVRLSEYQSYTVLQRASMNGWKEIVQTLIDEGADVNDRENNDMSALHLASQGEQNYKVDHLQTVQVLLKHGADINARGGEGNKTALQFALDRGHEPIVQLLKDHGAVMDS